MKKLILLAGFLICAMTLNAQNIYNSNGNLTSPRTLTLGSYYLHFKPSSGNGLFVAPTGRVGIGMTSPTESLDVAGAVKATAGYFTKSAPNGSYFATNTDRVKASLAFSAGSLVSESGVRTLYLLDMPSSNMDPDPVVWFGVNDRDNYSRFRFRAVLGGGSQFYLFDKAQTEFFKVSEDGSGNAYMVLNNPNSSCYVGIGTESFNDGSDFYRLSVNGKMRAHEVKVYTTWADYVFEDDYKLKSLGEVEQFISENGHLPNVPSAKEVEENGLELGEITKIQQEKIEELTLYLIEQKKESEKLKEELNELKDLVDTLMKQNK